MMPATVSARPIAQATTAISRTNAMRTATSLTTPRDPSAEPMVESPRRAALRDPAGADAPVSATGAKAGTTAAEDDGGPPSTRGDGASEPPSVGFLGGISLMSGQAYTRHPRASSPE